MTPQDALAALVGRALTDGEVAQIDGHLTDPLGRRDDLIAALLSTGRTKYVTTRKVAIGVVGAYPGGPLEADILLDKLEAYALAQSTLSRLVGRAMAELALLPLTWGAASTASPSVAVATVTTDTSVTAGTITKFLFRTSGDVTRINGTVGVGSGDLQVSDNVIPSGATQVSSSGGISLSLQIT